MADLYLLYICFKGRIDCWHQELVVTPPTTYWPLKVLQKDDCDQVALTIDQHHNHVFEQNLFHHHGTIQFRTFSELSKLNYTSVHYQSTCSVWFVHYTVYSITLKASGAGHLLTSKSKQLVAQEVSTAHLNWGDQGLSDPNRFSSSDHLCSQQQGL